MAHPLSFQKHRLDNGLTVYWQRRPAMPWMSVRLCARAGHRYEAPDAPHVAHLLEHLLHYGMEGYDSPRQGVTAFHEWVAGQGFLMDNAFTTEEGICVQGRARLPLSEKMLRLFAAFMMRPRLTVGLEGEREIIRAERNESIQGEVREFERRMAEASFGDHPAATYTLWPDNRQLDSLAWSHVREHHERTFHPQNMSLIVVAGDCFRKWEDRLEVIFQAGSDTPFAPLPGPNPVNHQVNGPLVIRSKHERRRRVTTHLEYRWILPPRPWPLLETAAGTIEEMLTRHVREKMKATYNVTVETEAHLDYVKVTIGTTVAKEHAAAVRRAVRRIITSRRALLAAVSPRVIVSRIERGMPDYSIEGALDEAWGHVALDRAPPRPNALARYAGALDAEELVSFVTRYLSPDRCVVGVFESDE